MRGRLWGVRLLLLMVVSALVFSPLAVQGAGLTSQPIGWNHDPSMLMLPTSPTYPAVVAYRDLRLSLADRSFEKSELLLDFANQDAAAISTMARHQDFVSSAAHSATYEQTFDRCVGWLVIASQRGNDISYLLSRVKNDTFAQQAALAEAVGLMPDWSRQGIDATRAHVTEVLLQAIDVLEGAEAAHAFASNMALLVPGLTIPEVSPPAAAPPPAVPPQAVVTPPATETAPEPVDSTPESPAAPAIISMQADSDAVAFKDSVRITCTLAAGDLDDLSYSWWCSRGDLVASGTEATWIAPKRVGTYDISLSVSDSQGRIDSRSVEIQVLDEDDGPADNSVDDGSPTGTPPDTAPQIEDLDVTAAHKYLSESLGGRYSILVSRSCTIRCIVDDPDGLEFEWSATAGGKISGSGDNVVFTAPAAPCYSNVTVTTTNARGEQDSLSVSFYVSTCTYCF